MQINFFRLFNDYADAIGMLDNNEERGLLFTAIFAHVQGEEVPEMAEKTELLFTMIRNQIDRDVESLDDSAFTDKAKKVLVREYGEEGIQLWSKLSEFINSQPYARYKCEDNLDWDYLAGELELDTDECQSMVYMLMEHDIIDPVSWKTDSEIMLSSFYYNFSGGCL